MARHALVLYAALTALLLTIATAHQAVGVKEWCRPPLAAPHRVVAVKQASARCPVFL